MMIDTKYSESYNFIVIKIVNVWFVQECIHSLPSWPCGNYFFIDLISSVNPYRYYIIIPIDTIIPEKFTYFRNDYAKPAIGPVSVLDRC